MIPIRKKTTQNGVSNSLKRSNTREKSTPVKLDEKPLYKIGVLIDGKKLMRKTMQL